MYQPDDQTLELYAGLLVGFGLGGGKGIKEGEVVYVVIPESAKPLLIPLQQSILQVGAHPLIQYLPHGVNKPFFEHASQRQLTYTSESYLRERVATIDHQISIIAHRDKRELAGVDPAKIFARSQAMKYYKDALEAKENQHGFSRTVGLYGTEAMAQEAGLSLEAYWQQIIKACYLDFEKPIAERKKIADEITRIKDHLDRLQLDSLHIKGKDVDLKIKLGKHRKRLGGSGRNIPSYEIFVSPDRRGSEGRIRFNQPLYRYGNLITGIELQFSQGVVTDARATQNEDLLKSMITQENANKIGEFSLTDSRMSRIDHFMAETLYDENMGGPYGNTHIALGNAYKDSYDGSPDKLSSEDRKELGFNESAVHTDMISTSDRVVFGITPDKEEHVIYEHGKFTF